MNMTPSNSLKHRDLMVACLVVGPITLLVPCENVSGQRIQFFPIRSAPLGSPAGTFGDPVTPTFNDELGCWEVQVPGGVEVDIDIQGGGWGNAPGSPFLGAIQATVISAGYSNGLGTDLNPKGWPGSPLEGAYQADKICGAGGDGRPCPWPFDMTCDNSQNGICIPNDDFIFRPTFHGPFLYVSTRTLDYVWAAAAQNVLNTYDPDPSISRTFGGLILEVPLDTAGTYVIAADPDPNRSFMTAGDGSPIPVVEFTPACITIVRGACCMDADSDGHVDFCQDNFHPGLCEASGGLFLGI